MAQLLEPKRRVARPADSFPEVGDWYVIQVKSRQEKMLHKALCANRIGSFLPLMEIIRFYGKRKARVQEPMFPGYLFVRGEIDQVYTADRTGRVANIISVEDQETLGWELGNIQLAITCEVPLEPFAFLACGRRVEVRSGPFRGIQGIVERRRDCNRLLLQVDMLGRSMSVEVDASLLDPID